MDEETLIKEILSGEIPRETFKRIILELPLKEIKILSMALGLEDGKAHNLEKVCKRFKITKSQYKRILIKALKKYDEEIHRPVGAKRGWRYSYLNPSDFSNFEEFKDFVWKLFKKGYKIEKFEISLLTHMPSHLSAIHEMWICHKKARKCYILRAITEEEKKFLRTL